MNFENINVGILLVIGGAGTVAAAAWWIATRLGSIDGKFDALNTSIKEMQADAFPLSRASEVALRMAIENVGMRVPDPRDPHRVIVVNNTHTEHNSDE